MKTKEEILKEATKRTLNINEGSPLHDAVMKAMEEYAQQQVKNYSISEVREQIIDYIENEAEIAMPIDEVINKELQQLPLTNVIHWVSVLDSQPDRRDLAYLTYDESGFMTWRYWKGTFWEGEHIANEPKVTHWTIVHPPCV